MNRKCSPEEVCRKREEIDRLDAELVRLLNRRASIAMELAEVKQGLGWGMCDPDRERQVLAQVVGSNTGRFDEQGLCRIFRRIIFESRRMEERSQEGGAA